MNLTGLMRACRYSYPPNSLSLCGPQKQRDLAWYTSQQQPDAGTKEILSQFGTLYPYLVLIASHNHISDPFDERVVEAYWLGNKLLANVPIRAFETHMTDTMMLRKKIPSQALGKTLSKLDSGALPCHAFHVLNIYKRTGHTGSDHTIQTMDACIINWGKVLKVLPDGFVVNSKPLVRAGDTLQWGNIMKRKILFQGEKDSLKEEVRTGDWVSYHWGYMCEKVTAMHVLQLRYYTNKAITLANH